MMLIAKHSILPYGSTFIKAVGAFEKKRDWATSAPDYIGFGKFAVSSCLIRCSSIHLKNPTKLGTIAAINARDWLYVIRENIQWRDLKEETCTKKITVVNTWSERVVLNCLQSSWEAISYLQSPSQLHFDPLKNEKTHPTLQVGEIKKNSSQSNNCKGNEFRNPEEDTSPRPPYLGEVKKKKKKTHHIRGTIQLAFLLSVRRDASGGKSKVWSNKSSFQDEKSPLPPPSPSLSPLMPSYCKIPQINKEGGRLADATLTEMSLHLTWWCLAAHPWHFHCLFCLPHPFMWQWFRW